MKKKNIVIIIIVLLILAAILCAIGLHGTKENNVDLIKLSTGEQVYLNQYDIFAYSTQDIDVRYTLHHKNTGVFKPYKQIDLPDTVFNVKELYQTSNLESKPGYDQIYTWETAKYKHPLNEVLTLNFNSGLDYKIADRGYIELSLYQDTPKRFYPDGTFYSKINGYKCLIGQGQQPSEDDALGTYSAEIYKLDGKELNASISASNVTFEYFIGLVKWLTGGKYPAFDNSIESGHEKLNTAELQGLIESYKLAGKFGYSKISAKDRMTDEKEFYVQVYYSPDGEFAIDNHTYNFEVEIYIKNHNVFKRYYLDIQIVKDKPTITKKYELEI